MPKLVAQLYPVHGWPDSMQAALYYNRKRRRNRSTQASEESEGDVVAFIKFTDTNGKDFFVSNDTVGAVQERNATETRIYLKEYNKNFTVVATPQEVVDALEGA